MKDRKIYYKEFKTVNECELFIDAFEIKEEDIIDSKLIVKGLFVMWHYAKK